MRWPGAVVVMLAWSLPGCDLDLGPGPLGPYDIPTSDCLESSAWKLYGLDEGLLPVGHSVSLLAIPEPSLGVTGCDEAVASVRWLSTSPKVADFTPGRSPREAWLTGLSAGETFVSGEVALVDGRTFTAPLGWGGGTAPVRVVDGVPPPEGRQVLLEGAVDLEPEPTGFVAAARAYLVFSVPVAGVLDMRVDWDSVTNRVIAHMCPGKVVFPGGCVPIIDGTQLSGQKPASASTPTDPGPHTLWITNGGPGAETIRYQVGLVPGGP